MDVKELLESQKLEYVPKGRDYLVKCLNPEHDDSSPSMRIDQVTGIFNCFSCGYKGNLFSHFGKKADGMGILRNKLKRKIEDTLAASVGLPMPRGATQYVGEWRNISIHTYEYFEAFTAEEQLDGMANPHSGRIVFPIKDMSGVIVGFIGRHTTNGTPKYMVSPPSVALPLYPMDARAYQGEIILVEGIFDMLNLYDKGLQNVMCCFGVKNVNEDKIDMLKMRGITKVTTFFDNDDAGQEAASTVRSLCEQAGLDCGNIKFGDKHTDAGAMTEQQVQRLKSQLY